MKVYHEILNGSGHSEQVKGPMRIHPISQELPKYVIYTATRDCFEVRKPGYPRKSFRSSKLTTDEKKKLAIEYLNSLP
jgi:hypothetical protein